MNVVERNEIRSNSIYLLLELFSSFRARSTDMLLLLDGRSRKTDFENRENCHARERVERRNR